MLLASTVNIPSVDGWLDAAVILLVTAMVAVPSWLSIRSHRSISRVENQVSNGHKTPLREDLDRVMASMERLVDEVAAVRRELSDEENRRRSHVSDVHLSVKDLREEFTRRINHLHDEAGHHSRRADDFDEKLTNLEQRLDGNEW